MDYNIFWEFSVYILRTLLPILQSRAEADEQNEAFTSYLKIDIKEKILLTLTGRTLF